MRTFSSQSLTIYTSGNGIVIEIFSLKNMMERRPPQSIFPSFGIPRILNDQ
ncbi:MAG: hypothetical protein QGH24_03125 [Candidatus Marinimicrobia bacterium]|nr:hypothetical protein [Candidatus Neomarinimicrobiota bacterium]